MSVRFARFVFVLHLFCICLYCFDISVYVLAARLFGIYPSMNSGLRHEILARYIFLPRMRHIHYLAWEEGNEVIQIRGSK